MNSVRLLAAVPVLAGVLCWTEPAVAAATVAPVGGDLEIVRGALSVNQQATPGNYATYDVLKVFGNPAFLSYQPRTIAVAATTHLRQSGDSHLEGLAAGWAGPPSETGTFGFAVMASSWSLASFKELDLFGDTTGVTVAPQSWQAGGAGMFQWKFVSLGASYRLATQSYGIPGLKDRSAGLVDAGTAMTLGPLIAGAAYRSLGDASVLALGAGMRFKGAFKGTASAEWNIPLDGGVKGYGGGGISWAPVPALSVAAGVQLRGGATLLTFGLSAPLDRFILDYAMAASMNAGLGLSAAVGAGWMGGRERAEPEGPKFFLEEKERTLAVMNFEAQNTAAGDAAVITDLLRSELVKQGAFNVVDKTNMDRILAEQTFQQTGCTSQECAVKLGKVLNVKFLVVGTFGKALGRYVLSMRVVEVETAKIIYTDEAEAGDLTGVRSGIRDIANRLTEAVKKR
ncbi:MAG: CsgG/HfaB family protein [Candidatus Coatesbacteria bacterium]